MPDKPHDSYQDTTGKTDKHSTLEKSSSSNTSETEEESAEDIKKKEQEEKEKEDSEKEEEFHPHKGKIMGIKQYTQISTLNWDKSYDNPTGSSKVTLHYDRADRENIVKYVYKGASCKAKIRRSNEPQFKHTGIEEYGLSEEEIKQREHYPTKEQLEEIEVEEDLEELTDHSDDDKTTEEKIQEQLEETRPYSRQDGDGGIYGFITDVTHDDKGSELEIKDWGFCLEDNTKKLSFSNMLRSQILEEVIKSYGLVPVVDFTGLKDDTITWTNVTGSGGDSGSGENGEYGATGDGSMTEADMEQIAPQLKYEHLGSGHDPQKGYDIVSKAKAGDCYDVTAWAYYCYNFKIGIPCRDIVGKGYGASGTHHVAMIQKNGDWVFPSWYANVTTNLKVTSEMKSGDYKVSREPPTSDGKIPPYRNDWYGNRS